MAFENMTYEYILERMIERVTLEYPNIDTREGSIIFTALAPAALELAIMYTSLDNVLSESFVNTATREYILMGCEQMGMDISVFDAHAGTHKGVFNVEVSIGSRWNCELYNYQVTEFIEQNADSELYEYRMICETAGTGPNTQTGDLTAITEIPDGLMYAKVVECLIEGEDETPDEKVRSAYLDFVNSSVTGGNIDQYEQWCADYDGVGNYKVVPLWNGANTVKVSILSISNRAASQELIDDFQEYLDPNTEGMGNGVAPIGAFVTVSTATEIPINVSATVTMQDGYSDTSVIDDALVEYFSEIAYKKSSVAYMSLGAKILDVEGVEFINNLLINGGTSDIMLGTEEIPIMGTYNWTVTV